MINVKSFKLEESDKINEFLKNVIIKGEMKLHEGLISIFYEVDDKDNRANRVQYLRGMLEAHFKKQWEYEEQMLIAIQLRDLFDKEEQKAAWEEANRNVVTSTKMLEMEILNTKVLLGMLANLGVSILQPIVTIPPYQSLEPVTLTDVENKMTKNKKK